MADNVTHSFSHEFNNGYRVSAGIPSEVPANVSMEVIITLTENSVALDASAMTVTMKARPTESPVTFTTLATGSVGGVGNNELTFVVPKDTILDGWSLYDNILFIWEGEAAGVQKFKIFQNGVTVISDLDADKIDYPYSEDIGLSVYEYSVPTTLVGKPGYRIVFINGTTVTLPVTGTYEGQRIEFIAVGAVANVINPNGKTINGVAGNQSLNQYDGLKVYENGGNWIAVNPSLTIP